MTSQQFPPASDPAAPFGGPPTMVQQPGAPFTTPGPSGGRRPALIAAGGFILVAGVAAGIVMVSAAGSNYDEGVQKLARAPIGCTTALRFDDSGTFTIYVETVGSIGDVNGDCPGSDSDYSYRHDDLPDVELVLTDDQDAQVDLSDDDGKEYDAAGFTGKSIASVVIEQAGDYDLTVTSDDTNFAIAVGKNPKQSADTLRGGGGLAFIGGVVIGGLLLVLGLRRRKTPPPAPAGAPMGPQAYAPAGPYGASQPYTPPSSWAPSPPAPPGPASAPGSTWPPVPPPAPPPTPAAPPPGPPNWPAPPTG